ncbi:MAG: dihydroorotate dehydrogenase electron transfer subunit [Clostridiaceae bacterium]|nr:dihydroorotate dehydrogenase electron transfer subunit [Clostridiaceae bacterium]
MSFNVVIDKTEKLAEDIYFLRLKSERVSGKAVPGQFVNIKCSDGLNTFLRRPISILRTNPVENTFDIVYMIRGKGTRLLSCLNSGDTIDCMGPLGKGFTLPEKGEKICVIGGGIGVFPLLFLLEKSIDVNKTAFLGFRTKDLIVLQKDFEQVTNRLIISTDDGSFGENGLITKPFLDFLETEKPDRVYTCGPLPMMKTVAEVCIEKNIFCEVSMEQRMGCGIGACLVCACKTRHNDDYEYERICRDGPVFGAEKIVF